MSVSEKLLRLAEVKASIRAAIVAKGVSVSEADSFASYAARIAAISGSGSGGGEEEPDDPDDPSEYTGNLVASGMVYDYGEGAAGSITMELPFSEVNVWSQPFTKTVQGTTGQYRYEIKLYYDSASGRWLLKCYVYETPGFIQTTSSIIGQSELCEQTTGPWAVSWEYVDYSSSAGLQVNKVT